MSQNGQPSFEGDIRPLFRETDNEDVRANADAILEAVAGGGMPCDGPRPPEQVDLLRRWVAAGTPA